MFFKQLEAAKKQGIYFKIQGTYFKIYALFFCEVPYVFFFPLQYISQAVNSSSCLYCFYGISLLSQVLSPYLHVNCV